MVKAGHLLDVLHGGIYLAIRAAGSVLMFMLKIHKYHFVHSLQTNIRIGNYYLKEYF